MIVLQASVFILFLALVSAGTSVSANPESDQTRVYKVEGMTCALCNKAIQKSLRQVEGVKSVDVDRATKRVTVRTAPTVEPNSLKHAIESAGSFTATQLEADDG
jgi:Cu+-exporting ATPase